MPSGGFQLERPGVVAPEPTLGGDDRAAVSPAARYRNCSTPHDNRRHWRLPGHRRVPHRSAPQWWPDLAERLLPDQPGIADEAETWLTQQK